MITSSLADRIAVISGGASGIGAATSRLLAEAGARVVILDRNVDQGFRVAGAIADAGRECWAETLDLEDGDAISACIEGVLRRAGRIDILINAAGILGSQDSLLDLSEEDWELVYRVNLRAAFLLMKHAARDMKRRNEGRIVNVTSSAAFRAVAAPHAYAAAKAGLTALTRTAAGELAAYDINVNAVAPGLTLTPMVAALGEDHLAGLVRQGPLANLFGRLSTPQDVAAAILFLCLPASRQITGQTIHTSAGLIV